MNIKKFACIALSVGCLVASAAPTVAQSIIQKTETFNTAASAAADGWWEFGSRILPNNYGFSPTSNAGGPAGEAGGYMPRTNFLSFYGDVFTQTASILSLSNTLSASGVMNITEPMVNDDSKICYFQFDTSGDTVIQPVIGLVFNEPDNPSVPEGHRLFIFTPLESDIYAPFLVYPNVVYTWSWTYQPPPAGTNNNGLFTLTWLGNAYNENLSSDTTSNQFVYSFVDNAANNTINAYGIYNPDQSLTPNETFTVFYDDLSYTAVSNSAPFVPKIAVSPAGIDTTLPDTNLTVTLTIPPQLNAQTSYTVTITSANTNICEPTGTSGTTNVVFPAGGSVMAVIPLTVGPGVGSTVLNLTAPGGTFSTPGLTVNVITPNTNAITKTESFDSAFSAGLDGWMEQNSRNLSAGMNYGFSPTQFAGGASAGEGGGNLQRNSVRTSYSDVWDSADYGRLSLSDSLSASGRVSFVGSSASGASFAIGYTDSTRVGLVGEENELAIEFKTEALNGARADLQIGFADGSELQFTGLGGITGAAGTPLYPGRSYQFQFNWDPTGGDNGGGLMTASLYDEIAGATYTGSLDLTPAQRDIGASFDSFGIFNMDYAASTSDNTTNYIDDLTYTALPGGPCGIIGSVPYTAMVVPQTNNYFTVTVPGSIDTNTELTVNVVSTNPAVAYLAGASGGTLPVTFPAGRTYLSTNIPIVAEASGTTMFYLADASSPACISPTLSNAVVSVSCGQVTLSPSVLPVPQDSTNQFVTVSLPVGLNQSGPVSVNLSSSSTGVATPLVTAITFPQGGATTTNVYISGLDVGTATLSLNSLVGAGCATISGSSAVTVACSPITVSLNAATAIPDQTNVTVTVSFQSALNQSSPVTVNLVSLNPSVALPQGAAGNSLALTFAAGASSSQVVPLNVLTYGTASLVLTDNSSAGCSTLGSPATLIVAQPDATNSMTETFDTPTSAAADGWVEINSRIGGEDFGYSATGNASGTAGEAGGIFERAEARAYYVTTNIGSLSLNDYMSASGLLIITGPSLNASFSCGFVNTNDPPSGRDVLGFDFGDNGSYPFPDQRIWSAIGLANQGADPTEKVGPAPISPLDTISWSWVYNPTGGPAGSGQQILSYEDISFGNVTYYATNNLTSANRAVGATFNAFGLMNRGGYNITNQQTVYFDNLTYTVGGPVQIQGIQPMSSGGQLKITFSSFALSHTVQQTTSLSPVVWTTVPGASITSLGNHLWSAQVTAPDNAATFYRVVANQ